VYLMVRVLTLPNKIKKTKRNSKRLKRK
jgi:hypothetical protein